MDGTIEISEENGHVVWELNLCDLPALAPQQVDASGQYKLPTTDISDDIPVYFAEPTTVAARKKAA